MRSECQENAKGVAQSALTHLDAEAIACAVDDSDGEIASIHGNSVRGANVKASYDSISLGSKTANVANNA